ncbi:methyltransferase [Oceanobacillus oncorhynchi subsp. incaldanensis]|uniref:methyltransferase n=1 Tax=Oceanobacillus oncorhynchi TaxID=545501 RepID=UPI0018695DAD|nr:methyltransferase [Oceanobacillus oncorhynchi]UUI38747.1 SAM-dependent methyltransferase [Oceanobacillus oncorhynchi]GIO18224.1 methyltransferase [Oceanobacillus oncorhynchi subsp. incaldanensis]
MKDKYYDKLLQIHTIEDKKTIYPESHHYNPYEPTPYSALEKLTKNYTLDKQGTVIDFGCGKGRLAFYLDFFQQISVTGIEMNTHFFNDAQHNLQTYTQSINAEDKRTDIQFICCLAEEYKIRAKDNHFYFFNPFSVQIFKRITSNILKSVEEAPRMVDIILYYPHDTYIQFLEYDSPFELLQEIKLKAYWLNPDERLLIYRFDNEQL